MKNATTRLILILTLTAAASGFTFQGFRASVERPRPVQITASA